MNFEYDIFLSFSSKDYDEAKNIWNELNSSNLRIYWSDETLKQNVGKSFFRVIQDALMNSKNFILLWTKNASESSWVRLEYEAFFEHCHLNDTQNRRFVIYEGKHFYSEIPLFLKSIQTTQSLHEIIFIAGGVDIRSLQEENAALKNRLKQLRNQVNDLERLKVSTASISEHLRKEYPDVSDDIKNAHSLKLFGTNLSAAAHSYYESLEKAINNGTVVKFLACSPEKDIIKHLVLRSYEFKKNLNKDDNDNFEWEKINLKKCLELLFSLTEGNPESELKVLSYVPPFGLIFIENDGQSYVLVKIIPFRSPTGTYPVFKLDKTKDKKWYDFFDEQFNEFWAVSRKIENIDEINRLTKN